MLVDEFLTHLLDHRRSHVNTHWWQALNVALDILVRPDDHGVQVGGNLGRPVENYRLLILDSFVQFGLIEARRNAGK